MTLKHAASLAAAGLSCAALILSSMPATAGSAGKTLGPSSSDIIPLALSGNSKYLLVTNGFSDGLKLVHTASGKAVVISTGVNAGVYATLSADGEYVCYKAFEGGGTGQVPMLYDVSKKQNIALSAAAPLAGTPAVGGGTIAYTLGNQLIILDENLSVKATYDLGHHVNTLAVSPDGGSVAYNDASHQIVVLDVATGGKSVLTDGSGDFWGPQFSPNGDKVLATSAGGVVVAGEKGGKAKEIGKGHNAGWADNNTVAFTQKAAQVGFGVISTEVIAADVTSGKSAKIAEEAGDAHTAVARGKVLVAKVGSKAVKLGAGKGASEILVPDSGEVAAGAGTSGDVPETQDVVDTTSYKYLNNLKYIHQNNDTPDYWNGNSSCSAASSLMALQYYNILPKHPMTSSWPTPHTSDYGWYIPEQYSFNGYSYTAGSYDPNGRLGWGAFGYITRNNWADTKTYMRDFIQQHGPSSGSVDWSPTFAEAKTEIDGNKPFVLLNSLTTAGHYITTTGYYKSQYTLIFWDPYGNKNTGYYPSDNGRDVRYDWPGYNNGYRNLNTVHCYIYCRFTPPGAPSGLTASVVSSSQINLSWTDNSWCEEFVDVFRSTSSTSGFTKIATLNTNATSYSSTGLAAGTTYYYQVKARTPAGSSAASNTASAKTTGGTVATIIVDNSNSGFTASANWSTGTSAADKYGTNYRFRNTAAISDAAVWSFNITSAQNYAISAWWSAGTNRSATAPFILPDNTTVNKNQQTNGGMWNLLGTKSLSTGTKTVKLSCWTTTGYVVLADAIKVAPQ